MRPLLLACALLFSACSIHIPVCYICKECGQVYYTYNEAYRCHRAIVYGVRLWVGRP
jgi:hypothetical protein